MPQTIRKMSGAVADRYAIKDRGYLKEGYFADITVFNEMALREAQPDQERSFGIEQLYINGIRVLHAGAIDYTAIQTSGRAIRIVCP
jgi:N-acyl-D-aspartate/D-glutamate deacylase